MGCVVPNGHCVVLAGPGSGKTKTLTAKLARMLAEDVASPCGAAGYYDNNECAKELELRLDALGIDAGVRGVDCMVPLAHPNCVALREAAGLGLPDGLQSLHKPNSEQLGARLQAKRFGGPTNPQTSGFRWGVIGVESRETPIHEEGRRQELQRLPALTIYTTRITPRPRPFGFVNSSPSTHDPHFACARRCRHWPEPPQNAQTARRHPPDRQQERTAGLSLQHPSGIRTTGRPKLTCGKPPPTL